MLRTVPPGVECSLSALGRGPLVPLSVVADWADQHAVDIDTARRRREGRQGCSAKPISCGSQA
ncbi:hypothetical protein [Saccharopolyspora kobensis]|uniref:hypothetical protein n=1 Tax=Saccharopolyspora kobensis TaxID=146035 RepID=UPI0011B28B99